MTQRITVARHRAACRPSTPLTAFGNAVTGASGKRAFAVVASSGLALTLGASTAVAIPEQSDYGSGAGALANATLDNDTITTSPTVSVDADIEWAFTAGEASSEAPPPPPPPTPTVTERPAAQQAPAARTGQRTQPAAPAAPQEETQAESQSQAQSSEQEAQPSEEPTEAPAASASGSAIVDIARRYVGTPYVHGGTTPAGFDCSGFTSYVYAQAGISLPRTSGGQRGAGRQVSASEARPGDLVWGPGHVGIYTGNGQHIAARSPGTPLHESQIWISNPVFIRVAG